MRRAFRMLPALICSVAAVSGAWYSLAVLEAQPNQFQFVVGATDGNGSPVTDLKTNEIVMTENGAAGTILKVEPYRVPVKVTLAVDNSPDSRDAISHYRTGLSGLVKALPSDVEVTVISTAPQPRTIISSSTDRAKIERAINGFGPDDERPRFTDTIVEFSQRLEKELRNRKGVPDSLPVLVMVSTTANEVTSYQTPEVEKALNFLASRKARLMVAITSTSAGAALRKAGDLQGAADATGVGDLNTNRQSLIAIPTVKATRGRYEAIAVSSRLATLLPEFGRDIAALHNAHVNQVRVTVERANNATGPFNNLRVELSRPGLTGKVSADGLQ